MKLKNYSYLFRIWHWANSLVVLGLMGTVFLRKGFLSYKTNAGVIQSRLAENGTTIDIDLAKAIAKSIREPMWDWHYILGFSLIAMIVVRLVLHFSERPLFVASEWKQNQPHKKLAQLFYSLYYLVILFMGLSGLSLYFGQDLGLSKDLQHIIKEIHETGMIFFIVFVPLHLIGLVVAENRDEKGVVSNMIGR
ncbi:MAG: cytochrome b/b6 domain-containing protein [Leptospiraceae bacterium]|nr:cytochrome b/b6 domain-containing protein [Leptospiraceae bacterium]